MTGDTPTSGTLLSRLRPRYGDASVRGRPGAPWFRFLLIAFATTLLVLRFAPYLSAPEFGVLNAWFRCRPARQPDPRIVIIGIEKDDIETYNRDRPDNCTCGARPRDELGRMVSRVKSAGAAIVAIDLFFEYLCSAGRGTVHDHSAILRKALEQPGESVLVARSQPLPDKIYFTEPPARLIGNADPIVASPVLHKPRGIICGVDLVQSGAPTKSPPPELQPLIEVAKVYPAFALAAYSAYMGVPREIPRDVGDSSVLCASLDIPFPPADDIYLLTRPPVKPEGTAGKRVMLTNWVGPIGTFPTYSYRETVHLSDAVLAERCRGKIVIVGSLLEDRQHTPMSQRVIRAEPPFVDQTDEQAMSGPEIHANCLDTILQQRFLRTLPRFWASVLVLLSAVLAAAAFGNLRLLHAIMVVVAEVLALFVAARILVAHDFWLYSFIPSLAVVSTGTFSAILCYSYARQEATELTLWKKAWEEAAGIIYHDNVQPLAAIIALVQVLRPRQVKEEPSDTDSTRLLALIDDSANQALANLQELRDLISDRPLRLEKQEFDLLSLIRNLSLAQSTKSSIHEVEVRAAAGELRILGDPRRIGRVFNNLLDNAIKYWPDGGTILVDVTAAPDGAVVKVTDGGMGIPLQQQAQIFEMGGRATPAGTKIAGSGIGLYSVRRIIEAHLGTVTVDSEPGQGSTFTVTLPHD